MYTKVNLSQARRLASTVLVALCVLLSKSSPAKADTLRYLAHGDQALMQMAELIKSAQRSIDFTYYIFDPCNSTTKILIELLKQKAQSGVKVRIVLDPFTHNKELESKLRDSFLKSGIDLRYYNRVGINPHLNYRSHAKVMIADSERYISGGRNIADDYFSVAEHRNFIDRDVYVEGRSAMTAQVKFNRLWTHSKTYIPPRSTQERVDDLEKNCLNVDDKTKVLMAALDRETSATLANAGSAQCENVTFTMDDPAFWNLYTPPAYEARDGYKDNPYDKQEEKVAKKETTAELLAFLREPIQELVLENWSYIPSLPLETIFNELRAKNVPITVVTNSESDEGASVEIISKYYSTRDHSGSQKIMTLSTAGSMGTSWSQTPGNAFWMLHSKVFVSNASNVAVTSFNLDPRSFHTNIETGVFVRNCPAFASHVLEEIELLAQAHERDKNCEACKRTKEHSVSETIKAWLSREFL